MDQCANCPSGEIIALSIQSIEKNLTEIKQDIKHDQNVVDSRLKQIDAMLQDFRLQQVKLEERLNFIDASLINVEKEFTEASKFRGKVILSLLGGAISFIIYIVQHAFLQ